MVSIYKTDDKYDSFTYNELMELPIYRLVKLMKKNIELLNINLGNIICDNEECINTISDIIMIQGTLEYKLNKYKNIKNEDKYFNDPKRIK